MKLAFILTMPGCPSWNGKWSGEGRLYCIVRSFSTNKGKELAAQIAAKGYYSYGWSDGWRAGIQVKVVDAAEARKLKSKSVGFNGYDWMVDTIINYGKPMADHEVAEFVASQREPAIAS
jgi:hypothetical protein